MSNMIGLTITFSKSELKDLIRCLDPEEPWIKSDYVEQLSAFLKETLANYKDEEKNE